MGSAVIQKKSSKPTGSPSISKQDRHHMIAEAAYYNACIVVSREGTRQETGIWQRSKSSNS